MTLRKANSGHLDDRTKCTSTITSSPSPTKIAANGFSKGHKSTVIKKLGEGKGESRLKVATNPADPREQDSKLGMEEAT